MEDITRPAVRDFIEGLVVKGKLALRTTQNITAVMSSCLGYGVEMEVLQTNVAVRMKKLAKLRFFSRWILFWSRCGKDVTRWTGLKSSRFSMRLLQA